MHSRFNLPWVRSTTRRRTSWGSGSKPPLTPLIWSLSSGPQNRPNPTLQRVEFFRFFDPCGAKPRGGGGAPPTTLILLRNQRTRVDAASQGRARAVPTVSLAFLSAKIQKNKRFFFGRCWWGRTRSERGRVSAIASRCVPLPAQALAVTQ